MNPYRTALILIEQMRKAEITAPRQQSAMLCCAEKPDITFRDLETVLRSSKEAIAVVVKTLISKDVITYERPKKGQVREGVINLTDKGRRVLGL